MRVFLLKHENERGVYHLTSKEKNYLFRVLRLNVNDVFTAKDSQNNYYKAFLFNEDSMTLESTERLEETLLDSLSSYRGPFVQLTAFISVLKGKKNEIQVRALTEIGVSRIVLMETDFTQSPLSQHEMERIKAIIGEAVQQSGSKAPSLDGPVDFAAALTMMDNLTLILHQDTLERTKSLSEALSEADINTNISMMIGPEGGFSDAECNNAIDRGAVPVLLNTNILRAETAAIYTASAIQAILQN